MIFSLALIIFTSDKYRQEYTAYNANLISKNAYTVLEILSLDLHDEDIGFIKHLLQQSTAYQQVELTVKPLSSLQYVPNALSSQSLHYSLYSYQHMLDFMKKNLKIDEGQYDASIYIPNLELWINYEIKPYKLPWYFYMIVLIQLVLMSLLIMFLYSSRKLVKPWFDLISTAEYTGLTLRKSVPFFTWSLVTESAILLSSVLKKLSEMQKHKDFLIMALAHNIRTPITRVKLDLSLLVEEIGRAHV